MGSSTLVVSRSCRWSAALALSSASIASRVARTCTYRPWFWIASLLLNVTLPLSEVARDRDRHMTRGERALVKSVEHGLQALCAEVGARWDESRVWFWSGEDALHAPWSARPRASRRPLAPATVAARMPRSSLITARSTRVFPSRKGCATAGLGRPGPLYTSGGPCCRGGALS